MKTKLTNLALGLLLSAFIATPVLAQKFSAEELNRRTVERRAVEAVIWGMPASPEVIEGLSTSFAKPDSYPVAGRGITATRQKSIIHEMEANAPKLP